LDLSLGFISKISFYKLKVKLDDEKEVQLRHVIV